MTRQRLTRAEKSAQTRAQLMASARANGDGGLDHSALLKLVEQLSGRS